MAEKLKVCDALVPALQEFAALIEADGLYDDDKPTAAGFSALERIGKALPKDEPLDPDSYSNAVGYIWRDYPAARDTYAASATEDVIRIPVFDLSYSINGVLGACEQLPELT